MKKVLASLLLVATSSVYAQKVVPMIWPFSIASSQATMVRSVIEAANSQQNKYQFVFVNKPGAGGAIGAIATKESKELAVLVTTSSVYIRPLLFKDSHNINDFAMVAPLCVNQPIAIFSKNVSDLSVAKTRPITVGVIPGSITTLLVRIIQRENPDIKILEVPYKGTPEATSDVLAGHIDGSVDWMGSTVTARFGKDIKVLGMTGTRSINGYPTFQSLKVKGLEKVTADNYFFVNNSVPDDVRQELYKILNDASMSEKPKTICESDFGQTMKIPYNQLVSFNESNKDFWAKLTVGIPKE